MRLSAFFLNFLALFAAACMSIFSARIIVQQVERSSVIAVQERLIDEGYSWSSVLGDGLQVVLEGTAPTEADRLRAYTLSGTVVDASRVIDNQSVQELERLTVPEFAVEILRSDSGVTLMGLVPMTTDRSDLSRRLTRLADGQQVSDLLQSADYPAPETWDAALDYALRALAQLERSKISVTADQVSVQASANDNTQKRLLQTLLSREAPENVDLAIEISAPRQVISPFSTRFTLDENGAAFAVCAVDTPEAQARIMTAAKALGFAGSSPCVEGIGAPTKEWGEAVAMSIRAVGELGGGTVTIANTDIAVVAPEGTDSSVFERTIGELENALPDVFALSAELPVIPDANEGPPQFTATLSPEGQLQLRGKVSDDILNLTVENYARAKMSNTELTMGTRLFDGLPMDWPVRVLAALEALSNLSSGAVIVEPETVSVRGKSGSESANADITRLLIDKLGETANFTVDVTYEKQLDPIAGLPTPEECIENIVAVIQARKILFDPGSADLTLETQPVIDDIAEILRRCADLRIRISGYTDSQGRESMNLALSQDRAEAVLTALRARRVPVGRFQAIGFGEEDPIADNGTEAGREANRRIEFSLIVPEVEEEQTTLEALESPAPTTEESE